MRNNTPICKVLPNHNFVANCEYLSLILQTKFCLLISESPPRDPEL